MHVCLETGCLGIGGEVQVKPVAQSERSSSKPPGVAAVRQTTNITMTSPKATVTYKKKDGVLAVSDDSKHLFWTPSAPPGSAPTVTITIVDITNLQQTPESSPKVALKVFVNEESYVFSFTDKQAGRKEQEVVTECLRNVISVNKAAAPPPVSTPNPGTPAGAQDGEPAQPGAIAMAKAASSKSADDDWYDDAKLKFDADRQRSLLAADKTLNARYEQGRKSKPESISIAQYNAQFWSSRLHLLRAHAIETAQKQGEYNVLPEIRFTMEPGEKDGDPETRVLHITKDQIRLIWKQYPVVKDAYHENCPPLAADAFWTRFFGSRLLKKLKGERITQQDPPDGILDRYLEKTELGPASIGHVPTYLDLEGNEQNQSQMKIRPDETMRPSTFDKVPILRVLNNLSEKMLSHVAPEDGEAHGPIGMDEQTFEQLRLRDLANEEIDNRVTLNIRDQQRLVSGEQQDNVSKEAALYAQHDPKQVLSSLRSDIRPFGLSGGGQDAYSLEKAIGFDPDSDSEDEEAAHQTNGSMSSHFSAKPALKHATTDIISSIAQQRTSASADPENLYGLSQETYSNLSITHATTTEFLHYFWNVFLSGDSSRTAELAQLVSTLDRSLDRINAVGAKADEERNKTVSSVKRRMEAAEKKTGKKVKYDFDVIPGGKRVVDAMVKPTVVALAKATEVYRKAFEEQTKEAAAAAPV
jgi:transcription initiation factor TFIIH subunit 1